jgi:hypothetical protein
MQGDVEEAAQGAASVCADGAHQAYNALELAGGRRGCEPCVTPVAVDGREAVDGQPGAGTGSFLYEGVVARPQPASDANRKFVEIVSSILWTAANGIFLSEYYMLLGLLQRRNDENCSLCSQPIVTPILPARRLSYRSGLSL